MIRVTDYGKLPFVGKSFDATVAIHILEYLPPSVLSRSIMEINRVTRYTTVIAARVPNLKETIGVDEGLENPYPIAWWEAQGNKFDMTNNLKPANYMKSMCVAKWETIKNYDILINTIFCAR